MKKLLLLPILFLSFAQTETIECKVIGVTDGNTIKCLIDDKKEITVDLIDIDAPELDQPYGEIAKQIIFDILYGRYVDIEIYDDNVSKKIVE